MKQFSRRLAGLTILLLISLSGCDSEDSPASQRAEEEPFRIVATTTQAADLLSVLTTDTEGVEVTALMGAGVDPHLYQPTEGDVAAMNRANMVVYSGLNLEGQFDRVFQALRERDVVVYALGDPVREAGFVINAASQGAGTAAIDPHFWFDPRNWQVSVEGLVETLSLADPERGETYRRNGNGYTRQLDLLYRWAESAMHSVPAERRNLVTSHDAFQYFGDAFGWVVYGIQGLSTEDEAGVGDIQETVEFVLDRNVPVLFVESTVSPRTIEAVREAIGAQRGTVRLGLRELYSDAMGSEGTFGESYLGMFTTNVLTILRSYECAGVEVEIPDWPEGLPLSPPEEILRPECGEESL